MARWFLPPTRRPRAARGRGSFGRARTLRGRRSVSMGKKSKMRAFSDSDDESDASEDKKRKRERKKPDKKEKKEKRKKDDDDDDAPKKKKSKK